MAQFPPLSSREQEVASLVQEGRSNKQIASSLHITVSTVEFHLKNIYAKLQVRSRTELIVKLQESVVAKQEETAENRTRLNTRKWAASLREAVSKFGMEETMENTLEPGASGAERSLSFAAAIRICLTKYADFQGRASRSEFWWFALFVVLVGSALEMAHEVLAGMFLIAVLLPLLAAGARRLRDSGKNPWWLLFLLVPVGGIITLGILWALPPVDTIAQETPAV